MHKETDAVKTPQNINDQRPINDLEIQSSSAVVGGPLSVTPEDDPDNFFDYRDPSLPRDPIPALVSDEITENMMLTMVKFLSKTREEAWTIVEASNADRRDKLSPEDLQAMFNKVTAPDFKGTLSLAELMSTTFPPARYVIEPFFEVGAVNMLSAPPNNWKSWFLFYFASCIAEGTPVFGKFPTEQAGILIVNEEDSHRSVQDRFNILQVTNRELPIHFRIASGSKLTKDFIASIIVECKEKNLTMVMFDSLRSMHEADENDSTTMQAVMDHLKALSREKITVLFTHHNRKKSMFDKGDNAEASRGSSAINAAVSGYVSLEEEVRESGTYVIVRHLKSKVGEKLPSFEVKIIKDGNDHLSFAYEGEYKTGERKLTTTKDSIMALVTKDEWNGASFFIDRGIASKGIVRAALNDLVHEGALSSMSRADARKRGLVPALEGNPKEKLYSLPTDEELEVQKQFDELGE